MIFSCVLSVNGYICHHFKVELERESGKCGRREQTLVHRERDRIGEHRRVHAVQLLRMLSAHRNSHIRRGSGHVLRDEVHLALVLALGQGDVQWLGADDAIVHLADRLRRVRLTGEADETKSFATSAGTFGHNLCRRNFAE